jgi:hypothetical protein
MRARRGEAGDMKVQAKLDDVTITLGNKGITLKVVRKYRGHLVPTKVGRTLADDPVRLWWHLAGVLPDARSEPHRHAGVLYLVTVAATLAENDAMLAEGMTWGGPSAAPTSC